MPVRLPDNLHARASGKPTSVASTLGKVPTRTRRDEVVRALRRAILTGELHPGENLPAVMLAARLGVSRPTLREAVRELVHEGLLVQEAYKATRVADPGDSTLLDIAKVRVALETLAAVEAGRQNIETLRRELNEALAQLDRSIESGDADLIGDAHVSFHHLIYRASGNRLLVQIWNLMQSQTRVALVMDQMTRPDLQRMRKLHHDMADAVLNGDAAVITRTVESHIRRSAKELIRLRTAKPKIRNRARSS